MNADAPQAHGVHASMVVIGEAGVLLRGGSGVGKSQLAQALVARAIGRGLFARLVADDRVRLAASGGRLLGRAPATIAGVIEERGGGFVRVDHEPVALIRLVADLGGRDETTPRLPAEGERAVVIDGVAVARLRLDGRLGAEDKARRILDCLLRGRTPDVRFPLPNGSPRTI